MFCCACNCDHKPNAFGTQQRRKSAKVRICKNPIKSYNKSLNKSHNKSSFWHGSQFFSSFSEFADYIEFGNVRYFATEYMERRNYNSDDDD